MELMKHPERADRVAAAYALGTLRGGARRRFEAQARQSPGLRALALVWQERFAAMTELQPEQAPSPNVWKRIENELRLEAQRATHAAPAPRRGFFAAWPRAAFAGVFAAGVAFVLAGYLGLQLTDRGAVAQVAVLQDERSVPQLVVTLDARGSTLTVKRLGSFREGTDRSLQLWALPVAGAPRSLGVLDRSGVVRLAAATTQLRDVPALAVSLEPSGGAPPGSGPTGPVLFKGAWVSAS